MQDLIDQPARYLATVEEMLIAERMTQAADVARAATPRSERTGYGNWNGGTEQWTVFLSIDPSEYALLGEAKDGIEEQITQRFKAVLEPFTQDWYSAKLVPRLAAPGAPARPNDRVRRQIRQNIIDGLRIAAGRPQRWCAIIASTSVSSDSDVPPSPAPHGGALLL